MGSAKIKDLEGDLGKGLGQDAFANVGEETDSVEALALEAVRLGREHHLEQPGDAGQDVDAFQDHKGHPCVVTKEHLAPLGQRRHVAERSVPHHDAFDLAVARRPVQRVLDRAKLSTVRRVPGPQRENMPVQRAHRKQQTGQRRRVMGP